MTPDNKLVEALRELRDVNLAIYASGIRAPDPLRSLLDAAIGRAGTALSHPVPSAPEPSEREQCREAFEAFESANEQALTSFQVFKAGWQAKSVSISSARPVPAAAPAVEPSIDARTLYEVLKDAYAEAVAIDTLLGDPNRLIAKIAAMRDKVGALTTLPASSEPAAAPAVEPRVTEEMISAYLTANDAYWKRIDGEPTKLGKWRNGTPSEATRISLEAALATLPASPEPATQGAAEPSEKRWQDYAADWLRMKSREQESINKAYPDHAASYPAWRHRVFDRLWLAEELEAASAGAEPSAYNPGADLARSVIADGSCTSPFPLARRPQDDEAFDCEDQDG